MKAAEKHQPGIDMPGGEMNNEKKHTCQSDDNEFFIKETEDKKIRFSSSEFFRFIHLQGIRKVRTGTEYELVLVENYIVTKISTSEVKELVLKYVKAMDNDRLTDYILNKTVLFSLKYLDAAETIKLKMHRDKPGESFFYFQNGVVRITAKGIEPPVPYQHFKRLIWKDHIILRNYNPTIDIGKNPPVFQDFIAKLSKDDKDRFMRICSVMGYCLYDYKTSATSRAVIINDQEVSSAPEGGSGKSLIVDALAQLRKAVFYDGKKFNPNADFVWQKIDESVRIVSIDDVKRGFNFEDLFSIITSGFRNINKKNKDEIELSVEESPTIVITTNNILKGNSGSFLRRQYQVEVYQFFNKNLTPIDFYKNTFFSGWDEDEWARFDVFMLSCVLSFLRHGISECQEEDKQKKELIRATNQSFAEWMEDNLDLVTDIDGIGTISARDIFLEATNQKFTSLSERKFTNYLKAYCNIYGYEYYAMPHLRPRKFRIDCNRTR
jgi:hypothetical protein